MGQLGRDATRGQRTHAVVLGAGMAGLLAARVLASHFEQVTVVDRDRLPEHPRFRPGVPQSRHLHVLLGRGLECLEQLFAGFEADLVAAGAPVVKGSESLWLNAAGWSRRYQSPIRLLGCQPRAHRVAGTDQGHGPGQGAGAGGVRGHRPVDRPQPGCGDRRPAALPRRPRG